MDKFTKIAGYLMLIGLLAYFGVKLFINNTVKEGTPAPEIQATLINGDSFSLNSLKGKWVLVDFWGSWCGPCMRDVPVLLEISKKSKALNLEIVSIGLEKNEQKGLESSKVLGLDWKYQIIEEHRAVMLSPIARSYGVSEIPAKFLISPQGNIQKVEDLGKLSSMITN